ncbi:tail fiber assembly protein [Edwardsiella piscicida]|uniref:tail fiber assembly protein n=1 Tax=Edwardsiella piscicida TaxID=1263550 RepID=UPI001F1122BB|nr:tail fiber assembly protein [Edwardsiella piscicida]WGS78507.1 tail fiber assembly protein [Edwardsiella piscicida]WGS81892.1 tail fiber assembly protein [Edwardsiella piscicida]
MVIIHESQSGGVFVIYPASPDADMNAVAEKCVPTGVAFKIVDPKTLPDAPQYAWQWNDGGNITVNIAMVNEALRTQLISEANQLISDKHWPSKLALNRLSDVERGEFNQWLDYIDALNGLNPTNPVWPSKPGQ